MVRIVRSASSFLSFVCLGENSCSRPASLTIVPHSRLAYSSVLLSVRNRLILELKLATLLKYSVRHFRERSHDQGRDSC